MSPGVPEAVFSDTDTNDASQAQLSCGGSGVSEHFLLIPVVGCALLDFLYHHAMMSHPVMIVFLLSVFSTYGVSDHAYGPNTLWC